MHWTAVFRRVSVSYITGPPPVMCIVRPLATTMRRPRFILLAGVVTVAIAGSLYFWWRYDSLYNWFRAQDKAYFKQVTSDCDSMLKRYPIGSAGLESYSRASNWFELSVTDETLPVSIRALRPDRILVSTNAIWVNCGGRGRLDWGFMWNPTSEPRTWALRSCLPYSFETTLYVESSR
jgi:hypothetical protein